MNEIKRILLIGGPGTGKTTLIQAIEESGHVIHPEISRQVTAQARERGIDQLFLVEPFAFSDALLEGRIQQFQQAQKGINFYDRGIPDVPAYHVYKDEEIPQRYQQACEDYRYDKVFFLPPWKDIYQTDEERYETYEQAVTIAQILTTYYNNLNYELIEVPHLPVDQRLKYLLERI